MIEWLYRLSWVMFLLSTGTILTGAFILLKTHQNIGVYIGYAGFMGLAVSGFLMVKACGAP